MNIAFILISSTIHLTFNIVGKCDAGHSANPQVIDHQTVSIDDYPFYAAERTFKYSHVSAKHRCGGAVIGPRWILTAANCLQTIRSKMETKNDSRGQADQKFPSDQDFFVLGADSFDRYRIPMEHAYLSFRYTLHPNFFWNRTTFHGNATVDIIEYDIALVHLDEEILFDQHVGMIRLSSGHDDRQYLTPKSQVLSVGYGEKSTKLELTQLEVTDEKGLEFEIFCKTKGERSLKPDSGGPLFVKSQDGSFLLLGIFSRGRSGHTTWTRVSSIKEYVLKEMSACGNG